MARLGSRLLQPARVAADPAVAARYARRRSLVLRGVLLAAQAATILISWPLWQARARPPTLPALGVPSLDMGIPLLVSLVVVILFPLAGSLLHAGLLAVGFAMDQTRLQPEVVSMALLLFATTGRRNLMLVSRAHLVTLWFWAGISKLISPDFYSGVGPWLFDGLPLPSLFDPLRAHFGAVVIALELGAGLLALAVRTRRVAAAAAVALHLGALVSLGPLGHGWNAVIWPWNVALAVAAVALIAPWGTSVRDELARSRWPMRAVLVFLALYPLGYYAGAVDAYLSHHLYSADTPTAVVCNDDGGCDRFIVTESVETLGVPLPPEHRIFRGYFDGTCGPGDTLRITDPRRRYAGGGWESVRRCPP